MKQASQMPAHNAVLPWSINIAAALLGAAVSLGALAFEAAKARAGDAVVEGRPLAAVAPGASRNADRDARESVRA